MDERRRNEIAFLLDVGQVKDSDLTKDSSHGRFNSARVLGVAQGVAAAYERAEKESRYVHKHLTRLFGQEIVSQEEILVYIYEVAKASTSDSQEGIL